MENYRKKLEVHIRRKLLSSEIVHHIDGDSCNNSIDNLRIVSTAEHAEIHRENIKDWKKELDELSELTIPKNEPITDLLRLFFSEKQQYLIFKKLMKLPFSKTDREYFSRCIKKKIKAIAHPVLHKIASRIYYDSL